MATGSITWFIGCDLEGILDSKEPTCSVLRFVIECQQMIEIARSMC